MAIPCAGQKGVLRARVALLTETGAPDDGASNGYVTSLVSVQRTPVLEAGDDITIKDGDGGICQSVRTCDKIKGSDLVVRFCSLDPRLIQLMVGGRLLSTGGNARGMIEPGSTESCPTGVSFEWWTRAWDGSAQDVISGSAAYVHHVVPKVRFVPAAQTYENGIVIFEFNGKGEENAAITANGPFDDWPAYSGFNDGVTSAYGWWYETALPTASCAYVNVSSSGS